MSQGLLSCFYYLGEGRRCGITSPWPLFFCATHTVKVQRTPPAELLKQAAESVWVCTEFTEVGLPSVACRDFEHWGRLANCLTALSLHGYRDEDMLLSALLASLLSTASPWKHKLADLPAKGRTFEILVARLYLEELAPLIKATRSGTPDLADGVRVLWDQRLPSSITTADRQVDVLIRWYRSSTADVFTAVECKDTEVGVEDVEAFATKIRSLGAHNGVIASSIGFQKGAIETALRYQIDLRLVREEDLTTESSTLPCYLYRFRPTAVFLEPPEDDGQIPIDPQAEIRIVQRGVDIGTAQECCARLLDSALPALAWPPRIEVDLPDAVLVFPDGQKKQLQKLYAPLGLFQPLERPTLPQPRQPLGFTVRDVLGKSARTLPATAVPLRTPPTVEAGRFYTILLCLCYYCTDVRGDTIHWVLLADKQHGSTLDVEASQSIEEAHYYYPVEDPIALRRLEAALDRFKKISSQASA